jgi:hypothetical protein
MRIPLTLILLWSAAAAAELEVKYQDQAGTEWSRVLKHKETNGCEAHKKFFGNSHEIHCSESKEIDETSDAYKACQDLGWWLPSQQDWERLAREFDHTEFKWDEGVAIALTDKGEADFMTKFGLSNEQHTFASTTMQGNEGLAELGAFWFRVYVRGSDFQIFQKFGFRVNYLGGSRYEETWVICKRDPVS